jgi:tetratricopeptide (TPR) repeat protein
LARSCRRFLIVAAFAIGAILVYGLSVKWAANSFLQNAERAERRGDLNEAAESLKSYVRLRPDDIDSMARYGMICSRLGGSDRKAGGKALRILERVISEDPQRHDIRRTVARLSLRLGLIGPAKKHLETLIGAVGDDGEAESLLGECFLVLDRHADAAAWFDRATRHAPDRVGSYVQLAYILRGRLTEIERQQQERKLGRTADQVMDGLIAANPRSARAYLERSRYRRKFGVARAAVEEDLRRAYDLAPDDLEVIEERASWALEHHGLAEARGYLEEATRRHPRSGALHRIAARVELQDKRTQAGIRHLRMAVDLSPEDPDLGWTLADLVYQAGDRAEADRIVEKLGEQRVLSPARLAFLEARRLMEDGYWLEASISFQRASLDPELKSQASFWLCRCYHQLGDPDEHFATARLLVNIAPGSARNRYELGMCYLDSGRLDEAMPQFVQVTNLNGSSVRGWIALVRTLILRELRSPEGQRDWRLVDRFVAQAASRLSGSPRIPILRAEILAAQRRWDDAYRLLEEARRNWPEEGQLWIALAGLARRMGRPEEAAAVLDDVRRRLGDSVDLRLGTASDRSASPVSRPRPTLTFKDLSQGLEMFAPEDRVRLIDGLAVVSYRLGDREAAEQLWNRLAHEQPHNLLIRFLLFELAYQAGDRAAMDRLQREVERACDRPEYLAARPGSNDNRSRDEARQRIARIIARQPNRERRRLLDAYASELRRNQEWGISPMTGISILFLPRSKAP